jgi:hypothetical protein
MKLLPNKIIINIPNKVNTPKKNNNKIINFLNNKMSRVFLCTETETNPLQQHSNYSNKRYNSHYHFSKKNDKLN